MTNATVQTTNDAAQMKNAALFHAARIVLASMAWLLALPMPAYAADSYNAGGIPAQASTPFHIQRIAQLNRPWALAFLPDGRMLITEKPGRMVLLTQSGARTDVQGIPAVYDHGQNGLLDVAIAPGPAAPLWIYLTYVAPEHGGGVLTLARARLSSANGRARLEDLGILWRQHPASRGGQPGGIIAFDPSGQHLFLTVGDRMEPDSAQDPEAARGKILRMNLDGTAPADNPWASAAGVRALTWTAGHRNPYGLAFAPDGTLWEDEMGPKGGDELNRIVRGKNYGWPIVSNGNNYDGTPIPRHDTHPEFQAPTVYWTPVIAPSSLAFYHGALFPQWQGSALIGGLVSQGLVRIEFGPDHTARQVARWTLDARIRDIAVAPDGALWVIEDGSDASLLRLTPR
ncbi:Glucose/arabinose dehydrogenase OS=Castellaniella defragrans OX=75697 GN=HNR28_001503 PE=4 SV=1 [Castellaniella defragrans]